MENNESQTAQVANAQAVAGETPQENFEAKYKELQAKYEQKDAEYKRVQDTLDAVTPYVKWDEPKVEDDTYVSKKDVDKELRSVNEVTENRILELQFLVNHPELKNYKDTLVAPAILRLRRKYPLKPKEELLETAAKEVSDFLESERKAGEERVRKEKAKADAEAMSGLESTGVTPKKEDEPVQTLDDYVNERQKILYKKKGI